MSTRQTNTCKSLPLPSLGQAAICPGQQTEAWVSSSSQIQGPSLPPLHTPALLQESSNVQNPLEKRPEPHNFHCKSMCAEVNGIYTSPVFSQPGLSLYLQNQPEES